MPTDSVLTEEMLCRIDVPTNQMQYKYHSNKIQQAKHAGCGGA